MTLAEQPIFTGLLDRVELFLADNEALSDPVARAEEHLLEGETVLEAWLAAKSVSPTTELVEGFRLLALHRQGARGDASFNACRETCREIVYLRNVIDLYSSDAAQARHHLRLQAMVLRHLALFVGGKMLEAGLGDFCCASRPVRAGSAAGDDAAHVVGA